MSEEPKYSGLLTAFAEDSGLTAREYLNTMMACVMPGQNVTPAQVHIVLMVAKEHGLNPLLKEIHAFPGRGGSVQPIVGVDGWLKLANNHPQFDGYSTEFFHDEKFDDIGCRVTVHRKDRSHPVVHVEWLSECKRDTQIWKKMPRRMHANRATVQGLRRAFSFSGIMDPDEGAQAMEFELEPPTVDVEAKPGATAQETLSAMAKTLDAEDDAYYSEPLTEEELQEADAALEAEAT